MRPIERLRRLAVGVAAAALAACSSGGSIPSSLETLANAELVPGEALGSLRLGQTALGDTLMRHGAGRSSVVVGDEYAFELSYGGGQLSLLFFASEPCRAKLVQGGSRDAAAALAEPERFASEYSMCLGSTLASVAVAAPGDATTGFYAGKVRGQVTLGTRLESAMAALGPGDSQNGLWLAGGSPADARLDSYNYRDGLAMFTGAAPDGPDEGHLVVRKLAIFAP